MLELTRRTFLTTIAAAPLAKFCKADPEYRIDAKRGLVIFKRRLKLEPVTLHGHVLVHRIEPKSVVERRYNLPQGTLG